MQSTTSSTGFDRYIGIDYSDAEVPNASFKGLRVYMTHSQSLPTEVPPTPSPRVLARKEIAHWLADRLLQSDQALVGIDHGFSFPLWYFETYHIKPDCVAS